MMTIADFETALVEFVNTYMEGEPESVRKTLAEQFDKARSSRPVGDVDPAALQWRRYYRSLAGIAVDYCGAAAMADWVRSNAG